MGCTSVICGRSALLDDVVGAVVPDLEDREADATDHVPGRAEPDRRTEERRRHPDLADLPANLETADTGGRPRCWLPVATQPHGCPAAPSTPRPDPRPSRCRPTRR